MGEKKKAAALYLGTFLISLFFYLLWYWQDGVVLTNDAQSYIEMHPDREPGYCIFLAVVRFLSGEERALHITAVLQCIIAAVAACMLATALVRRFSLGIGRMNMILLIQYGITLLNKFVAQRHYSYYNSIETEGLTYSLWVFFFLSILNLLYDDRKRDVAMALFWAVALVSVRKQMLVALVILFFALLYSGWRSGKRKKWYAVGGALLTLLIGLGSVWFAECLYGYAVRGEFEWHTGDSNFILGTELYLADEGMAKYIQSDERRTIFREIMDRADEREYNIAYAGKGWQNVENHYSLSYDRIKFDIMMVVIREYVQETSGSQDNWSVLCDAIIKDMAKELLAPCMPGMIRLFGCNFISGMITTVLKVHRVLNPIAGVIYVLYAALFLSLLRARKRMQVCSVSSLPFAGMVLLAIVVNGAFTSVTIYPQMRYMLYNTAFFYQAGVLMVWERRGLRAGKEEGKGK